MTTLHDFTATTLTGEEQDLSTYAGKAVLVVNTASRCGLTPQYQGLQTLYDDYADRGLTVLGFPCDQFAHQEPGDADEISQFCTRNYGVTFPMFAKVDVNGRDAHPLWRWLRTQHGGLLGDAVKWNFTKFLVDPQGHVVKRYSPTTAPDAIRADLETILPDTAEEERP
ncbi:glutathione peroxidase [Arsenicicoccus dermatophilus]|uniref:glutathione peroxidase n=1 Tax=Arsenicicoccus dermatophilus TaxID=1076331 RepID=UPI003916CE48